MKKIIYPEIPDGFWQVPEGIQVEQIVREIILDVRRRGDDALREYTARFDGVDQPVRVIPGTDLKRYPDQLKKDEREAIETIIENVSFFAEKQKQSLKEFTVERHPGLQLGQRIIPLESAGIYVPSGNFPLVSTVVMCAVPAKVAGVQRILMATPPDKDGEVNPYIAAAAYLTGVDEVIPVGGAQAVAAMAYGTASIHAVDKIVGPGNAYVAEAKRQVYGQ
ncbi:MAG: histidinol dehydrogenase, partial [Methanobacteriota archaeon]